LFWIRASDFTFYLLWQCYCCKERIIKMNIIQRFTLYQFSLMLVFLIAATGCKTVNNTITPEPSVANLQTDSSQVDTEHRTPQTSSVEKEATTTEKPADKATGKPGEIEQKSLTELQKDMVGRWSGLLGHGGLPQSGTGEKKKTAETEKPSDKVTEKSEEIKKGPFVELEKSVIGKWLNLKETESIEFIDDRTIVIIDKRGINPILKGNFKFVDEGRLRVEFKGDFLARSIPPVSFKISISENEITLTDEPDGAATTYKRIE
jgi:hypothetical protein